jgi:hypothetical protein
MENENDHVPTLTGPYLATGMELERSEDIILTKVSADVYEPSLVDIAQKVVD